MIYIIFLTFTILVLFFAFYQWQYFMVFNPRYYREDILDERFEMLSIKTKDGIELEGVVYEPKGAVSTLLFFAGRDHDSVGLIKKLSLSFPTIRVVTFNYRSYGKSGGSLNEKNIFDDSILVARMIQKYYGDFYILGFSLGSSVASYVAAETDVLGVFLVGAFDNIAELAKRKFKVDLPWLYRYRFDTLEFVKHIDAKVYMFVSRDDEITYIQNARNLKKNIKNLAYYREYDGLSHHELLWHDDLLQKINKISLREI